MPSIITVAYSRWIWVFVYSHAQHVSIKH